MQPITSDDVPRAIEALEADGYVVLKNAVSADDAAELAALVMTAPQRAPGVSRYEFVVCLLNHDSRFLKLAMHPTVLELARYLLGGRTEPAPNAFAWPPEDQVRLGSVDGLVAHAGSELGWWHMDSPMGQLNQSRPLPDFPMRCERDLDADTIQRTDGGHTRVARQPSKPLPPTADTGTDGRRGLLLWLPWKRGDHSQHHLACGGCERHERASDWRGMQLPALVGRSLDDGYLSRKTGSLGDAPSRSTSANKTSIGMEHRLPGQANGSLARQGMIYEVVVNLRNCNHHTYRAHCSIPLRCYRLTYFPLLT